MLAYPKGQPDSPAEGRLTFIDNGVDTTTGMFKLKATFPNKDRRLWPGQFVDVALELSTQKNAIVVPTRRFKPDSRANTSMWSEPTARRNGVR